MSLAEIRREYESGGLRRADLDPDPIVQFQRWFQTALDADVPDANAMTLATADASGKPAARIVLLKGVDARGFVFFTNYDSDKGRDLAANPQAALLFYWEAFHRQVRIEGSVTKVSPAESSAYFKSRPYGAQLSAAASPQSQVVPDREALEYAVQELAEKHPDDSLPCPPNWGGYRVTPDRIEFWQGRVNRLHDRFVYTRAADRWHIERLAP